MMWELSPFSFIPPEVTLLFDFALKDSFTKSFQVCFEPSSANVCTCLPLVVFGNDYDHHVTSLALSLVCA